MAVSEAVAPHGVTPGPVRPVVELASLRRRLASLLYESLPAFGVLVMGGLAPQVLLGIALQRSAPGWLLWLHVFVLMGLYFVAVWRRNGQSLAMQTWSLQIVDAVSGKPASMRQLIWRYVYAWPSLLLILGGVGVIWTAFVDRDRQFPHDRWAGTCIVLVPRIKAA